MEKLAPNTCRDCGIEMPYGKRLCEPCAEDDRNERAVPSVRHRKPGLLRGYQMPLFD